MKKSEFEKIRDFIVSNEPEAWEKSQELRRSYEQSYEELFAALPVRSIEQAKERSFEVIYKTLETLDGIIDLGQVSPGHGLGHLTRDYLHASLLADKLDLDPGQAYVGIVGGVLHDFLGCSLIDRYCESGRVVRHAEAGGLLFMEIAKSIGISHNEALLIFYALAAHTHYLKPSKVMCGDGVERETSPYLDIDANGNPIMSVHLTRWSDRSDANGPCFIGRHYLTIAHEHKDYATEGHYLVAFAEHMRPLLRDDAEIKSDPKGRTLREHLMMFAGSQSNDSPYGRFDYGAMVTMRDEYKERFLRIIAAFDKPLELSSDEEEELLSRWTAWLSQKIEPSQLALETAQELRQRFSLLPPEIKQAWFGAMKVTLEEYAGWAEEMLADLTVFPEAKLILPALGDVRKII